MADDEDDLVPLVPGRSCGDCSLCCKLLHVEEFDKPAGKWCEHCAPGRGGCTVHETRPNVCRNFYCSWMTSPGMGPEWRPNQCNMVMYLEGQRDVFGIRVDPGDPTAWRREPHYGQLKNFAAALVERRQQLVVYVGERAFLILPNKDVDLGNVGHGDQIAVKEFRGPNGRDWHVSLKAANAIASR
jgi:hypothetical protein